jgi:hypothetical protein
MNNLLLIGYVSNLLDEPAIEDFYAESAAFVVA